MFRSWRQNNFAWVNFVYLGFVNIVSGHIYIGGLTENSLLRHFGQLVNFDDPPNKQICSLFSDYAAGTAWWSHSDRSANLVVRPAGRSSAGISRMPRRRQHMMRGSCRDATRLGRVGGGSLESVITCREKPGYMRKKKFRTKKFDTLNKRRFWLV